MCQLTKEKYLLLERRSSALRQGGDRPDASNNSMDSHALAIAQEAAEALERVA